MVIMDEAPSETSKDEEDSVLVDVKDNMNEQLQNQYMYIQHLLKEIEHLKGELDRLSVEVYLRKLFLFR